MTDKNIKIITISEAKELLDGLKEDEIDQVQRRTIDYVSKFNKLDVNISKKANEKLVNDCNFTNEEAVEILNIVPTSVEELRVFTSAWKKLIPTETLEKALKILSNPED